MSNSFPLKPEPQKTNEPNRQNIDPNPDQTPPIFTRKTDAGKLSEFLSEQDMKDLGLISNTPVPEQKETFWTLATKGAKQHESSPPWAPRSVEN